MLLSLEGKTPLLGAVFTFVYNNPALWKQPRGATGRRK
jgi:hypothetical protein